MADSVPFGKYKGRPVTDMLADADYMAWLEAQPWFREKFAHLRAERDRDAMSRTPVHNRLQAMFLDPAYCTAFLKVATPTAFANHFQSATATYVEQVRQAQRDAKSAADEIHPKSEEKFKQRRVADHARWMECIAALENAPPTFAVVASFEHAGADVMLTPRYEFGAIRARREYPYGPMFYLSSDARQVGLEIKPIVADDYPAVLRQMNRNKSVLLFVDSYAGEGATEAQFVAMFNASGKIVVFKRDVDAALAAE